MIDKLKEIIVHFESLELKMADPNFVNDQNFILNRQENTDD